MTIRNILLVQTGTQSVGGPVAQEHDRAARLRPERRRGGTQTPPSALRGLPVLLLCAGLTSCGTQTAPDAATPGAAPGAAPGATSDAASDSAESNGVEYSDSDLLLKHKVSERLHSQRAGACDPTELAKISTDFVRESMQQECAEAAQLKAWLEEPQVGGGIPRVR